MRTAAALALGLGLVGFLGVSARSQDKKAEAPNLEGKYTLVSGKLAGKAADEDVKKAAFAFTADTITVSAKTLRFVIRYKVDPATTPMGIDLEIVEGPEGTKGAKAGGILEVDGDGLKLAYVLEKDKRPKDFDGKEGNVFELKKLK